MFIVDVNGEAFYDARLRKSISQETLARHAGVDVNDVKKVEQSLKIHPCHIRKIVTALGLCIRDAAMGDLVVYRR